MAGRKRKPTKLKVLHGNPGGRPLDQHEPDPPAAIPHVPAHLNDAARHEWHRITKQLEPLGLMTRLDRAAIAAYCVLYARWVEAESKLAENGPISVTESGYPIQSPWLAISNKAVAEMRAFMTEFGMTPAARARLHVEPQQKADPLAELIARRRRGRPGS